MAKGAFKFDYSRIITRNKKMHEIFGVLDRVIPSDVSVMIQGQSGTGKELIAQAIHENSPRKKREFVAINCSAIPRTLLESELFGYMRGSFTGAIKDKIGLFEVADGGTLFMDEIGDMDLDMQVKLLRVLQEGEIRRVGGKNNIKVDVRVVAATNRDILDKHVFREDLYYRLNVINIQLPPLKDRKKDIPLLVEFFLERIARRENRPIKEIDAEVMDVFLAHAWPGNIRELQNELERAVAMSGDRIALADLSEGLLKTVGQIEKRFLGQTLAEVVAEAVWDAEAAAIADALHYRHSDVDRAAEILAISPQELREKMQRYAIAPPAAPAPGMGPFAHAKGSAAAGEQKQEIGSSS